MITNKEKMIIKIIGINKLIINDDYVKALVEIDILQCMIRCMADNNITRMAENEQKGGYYNEINTKL